MDSQAYAKRRGSERDSLEKAVYLIMNENGYTKSMRESLIREMRQGRTDNVRDINEQIHQMKQRGDGRL